MSSFRMPAEWEPQAAIWLTWPDNRDTWPEHRVAAQIEFTALVKTLAETVPVNVLVNPPSLGVAKRNLIQPDTVNIGLVDIPTNDAWMRDYGPTFVLFNRQLAAIDWRYNAWGEKYPPFDLDQQVAQKIARGLNIERHDAGLCFEGGALETNGQGLLLSTCSCAADPRRNPEIDPATRTTALEDAFGNYLGAEQVIWLPGDALPGDDTDGHIDQLARFVDSQTIVIASVPASDPRVEALLANRTALDDALRDHASPIHVIELPLPDLLQMDDRLLPGSYCNFLITNDVVVVPQFGCPQDGAALEILRPLFNDRYVVGLPSRHLLYGLGSFHCLTQQQPALPAPEDD